MMVYLSIVNRDVHHPVDVSVEGLGRRREATLFTVSGESPLARNTPENPSAVAIRESTWATGSATIEVEPHSFTMIVIPTGES